MLSLEQSIQSTLPNSQRQKVISTWVGQQGGSEEVVCHEQVLNEETDHHMVCKVVQNPKLVALEEILHQVFTLSELHKPREKEYHQPVMFQTNNEQKKTIIRFQEHWEKHQQEELLARSALQLVKKVLTFYVCLKTDDLKVELRTTKHLREERKAALEKQIKLLQNPMTVFLKQKPELLLDMVDQLSGVNKDFIRKMKEVGLFQKVKDNYKYYCDILSYEFKYTKNGEQLKEDDQPMVQDASEQPFTPADKEQQEYFFKKQGKGAQGSAVDLNALNVR